MHHRNTYQVVTTPYSLIQSEEPWHKWQPRRAPRFSKQHSKPNHLGTDWQHMSYRQSEEPSWRSQEHYDRHPAGYGDHQWSYSEQSGEYSDGSDMWNGYMDYMYSATRW